MARRSNFRTDPKLEMNCGVSELAIPTGLPSARLRSFRAVVRRNSLRSRRFRRKARGQESRAMILEQSAYKTPTSFSPKVFHGICATACAKVSRVRPFHPRKRSAVPAISPLLFGNSYSSPSLHWNWGIGAHRHRGQWHCSAFRHIALNLSLVARCETQNALSFGSPRRARALFSRVCGAAPVSKMGIFGREKPCCTRFTRAQCAISLRRNDLSPRGLKVAKSKTHRGKFAIPRACPAARLRR